MWRKAKDLVAGALLILPVLAGTGLAQTEQVILDRYRRRGEASHRYDTWRGRSRLPDVDLSLDVPAEGVEEEEPLFLEGLARWLRIHGGLGYQTKYTTNVFLQPGGVIVGRHTPDDIIHMITPSLRLELPSKRMPVKLDYFVDVIRAGHFENFDTEEHHLATSTDIRVTPKLSIRVSNDLARLGVEPRNPDANLANYITDTASASAVYRFGNRASVEAGWRHALSRFHLRQFRTSEFDADTLFLNTYYRLDPRFGLITEWHHMWVDNKSIITDDERFRMAGGFQWDITSRLNGKMVLGYEQFNFEAAKNRGTLYAHSELVYDWSKKLRLGFYADRSLRETTLIAENAAYGNGFITTQLSLNAIYKFNRQLSVTAGQFVIVDQYEAPPYLVRQFLAGLSRDTRARRDDLAGVSLGIQWQPTRYTRFGATFEHQVNRSNIRSPHVDFEESTLFLNASLGF